MQIIELLQGSPEWAAYRAGHFNASDAPAMMGCSTNKSRADLVRELATGVAPEFSDFVQRRILDKGHDFERLARSRAETEMGESLFPVTGQCDEDPRFSASFDGLDMIEAQAWEHKSSNAALREAFRYTSSIA